ncbi:DNA-binding response regulator [Comamonas phosphati]|nr:DNA-binding response regulator [Comamonas phosphati]
MNLRVLLVEDDPELRTTLREVMRVEGYEVAPAASLADARTQFSHAQAQGQERRAFDLVVLDLGLPDGEGRDFLATVRHQSACPVLIVSARHDDSQKIGLLDAGADDYLVKPFSAGELLARMRVALRHRGRRIESALTCFSGHGVEIDLARRAVVRDGRPVHLTPNELTLLAALVRNTGRVVTHRQLLSEVWGPGHAADTHYLRLYMAQLRAKLEAEPANPQLLLTETGVGYRLAEER